MAATADEIVDAVVAVLAAGSYAAAATPVKAYAPKFDQEAGELSTRRVTVSPAGEEMERLTRGGVWRVDYAVHVQLWYQLPQVTNALVAAEYLLMQQLVDQLRSTPLTGRQEQLIEATVMTHDIQRLSTDGLFLGAVTAIYRGTR